MSIPPLPPGLNDDEIHRAANALHSLAIHVLRRARMADRETGLSPERLSLLSVLVFAGPGTIGELARIEGVSAPAISRIVTALGSEGLARRARATDDSRIVRVSATAKGARLVEAARGRRIAFVARGLARLAPADLRALKAVAGILERMERPGPDGS